MEDGTKTLCNYLLLLEGKIHAVTVQWSVIVNHTGHALLRLYAGPNYNFFSGNLFSHIFIALPFRLSLSGSYLFPEIDVPENINACFQHYGRTFILPYITQK